MKETKIKTSSLSLINTNYQRKQELKTKDGRDLITTSTLMKSKLPDSENEKNK